MKKRGQRDAVIEVMVRNGGYSTLRHLYQNALKVDGIEWKTKTPYETIRRIVQEDKYFFKIKPGLWALNEFKDKLPKNLLDLMNEKNGNYEENKNTHSYYQGLIVEIGNMQNLATYVPGQDKNKPFLNQTLKDISTIDKLPAFTYNETIDKVKFIDVIWINNDRYPKRLIEVEFSTDFTKALLKFNELKYFTTEMYIAADKSREKQFNQLLKYKAFNDIRDRIKFWDFERIVNVHSRLGELTQNESGLSF